MKILLIDDDKYLTKSCAMSLRAHGHEIDVVNKSKDLANAVSAQQEYELIILDLMMRNSNEFAARQGEETGEAIFRKIRACEPDKKVIIITGKDITEVKTNFAKQRVAVISKPFSPNFGELHEAIADAM